MRVSLSLLNIYKGQGDQSTTYHHNQEKECISYISGPVRYESNNKRSKEWRRLLYNVRTDYFPIERGHTLSVIEYKPYQRASSSAGINSEYRALAYAWKAPYIEPLSRIRPSASLREKLDTYQSKWRAHTFHLQWWVLQSCLGRMGWNPGTHTTGREKQGRPKCKAQIYSSAWTSFAIAAIGVSPKYRHRGIIIPLQLRILEGAWESSLRKELRLRWL